MKKRENFTLYLYLFNNYYVDSRFYIAFLLPRLFTYYQNSVRNICNMEFVIMLMNLCGQQE